MASAIGKLSIIYKDLGNLDLAYQYALKNLEITKKLFGENHLQMAQSFGRLA